MDAKLAVVESLGIRNVTVWVLGGDNPWFSARALRTPLPSPSLVCGCRVNWFG